MGAFADHKTNRDSKTDLEDIPFLNLIQDDIKIDEKTVIKTKEVSKSGNDSSCDIDGQTDNQGSGDATRLQDSVLSNHSSISQELPPDDFVMVELVRFPI